MTIFDRVKEACMERGISIAQLEKDLGFSNKSVFAWKNSSPSVYKVQQVADYLGVTIDSLVKDKLAVTDSDVRDIVSLTLACSPSERKLIIRIIKAIRGE